MSIISFVPSSQRDDVFTEGCGLRLSLVECGHGHRTGRNSRSVAIDIRVHPKVLADWGVDAGDRVIGTVDAEGSWTLTKCRDGQKGYTVRIGGRPSASSRTGRRHKVHGRAGFGYLRFTCSRANARAVFGDRTRIECDCAGVDGALALFIPKVSVENMTFQPA